MTKAEISIVLMDNDKFHVDVVGKTVDIAEAIFYALQTFQEQDQVQLIEAFITGLAGYTMQNNFDFLQLMTEATKRWKSKP